MHKSILRRMALSGVNSSLLILLSCADPIGLGQDSVIVTEPNSQSVWRLGHSGYSIAWNGTIGSEVSIELYKANDIVLNIADNVPNSGQYSFTVDIPSYFSIDDDYRIKVIDNANCWGYSDYFSLDSNVVFTDPNMASVWLVNSTSYTISWSSQPQTHRTCTRALSIISTALHTDSVRIELWDSNGKVLQVTPWIVDSGSYTYEGSLPDSLEEHGDYYLKLCDEYGTIITSDNFVIGQFIVSEPSSTTTWEQDQENTFVEWHYPEPNSGTGPDVSIIIYQESAMVGCYAESILNSGYYVHQDPIPISWGYGSGYHILIVDELGNQVESDEFSITHISNSNVINVLQPIEETVWGVNQPNTSIVWSECPGESLTVQVYSNDILVGIYAENIVNSGSYERTTPIPAAWGTGNEYTLKLVDCFGNYGWSEEFSVLDFVPMNNPTTSTIMDMSCLSASKIRLLAGNSTFYTSDCGLNWVEAPLPYIEHCTAINMSYINEYEGWIGCSYTVAYQGTFVLHTEDGGSSWETQVVDPGGGGPYYIQVISFSGNYGIAPVHWQLCWTTNGGNSWQYDSEQWADWSSVDMLGSHAWLTGDYVHYQNGEVVMISNNYGQTWSYATWDDPVTPRCIDFVTATKGYIVADDGLIYRSTDGGETWMQLSSGITEDLNSVSFRDDMHGIAVGDNGVAVLTNDGGNTWELLSTGISEDITKVYCSINNITILISDTKIMKGYR